MDEEIDIERKYKKHADFRKQMDEIQNFYNGELNLALYENLSKLEERHIFGTIKEGSRYIVMFYGYRVEAEEDVSRLYRLYIRTYDEIFRNQKVTYSVIFFNTLCTSNDAFSAFKSIYRTLPRYYYSKLEKIYVVNSTWTVNILDWIVIGRLPKMFSRRLEYVKNIEELGKIKLPSIIMSMLPTELANYAHLKESKQLKEKQMQVVTKKKKSPFQFLILNIEKYEMAEEKIPRLLKILILTFKKNPSLLEREGVFRKSGNIQEEEMVISELAKKNEKVLDNADDGYVIAGLIKKFFTHLVEPILPFEFYQQVMQATTINAEKEVPFAKQMLAKIPQLNRLTIQYMVSFMREQVIKRQSVTKMTEYNCAVVFAPCFSRPRDPSFADLIGTGKMVRFLTILFTRYQEVYGCKSQKYDLCRRSLKKQDQKQKEEENRASTQSPKRSSNQDGNKVALNQKRLNI